MAGQSSRWIVLLLVAICPVAGLFAAPNRENSAEYYNLLRSTGWVEGPSGSGTCWLLDRDKRLAITNVQVVTPRNGAEAVRVIFPLYQDGVVLNDPAAYDKDRHGIPARVLRADRRRDLALLQLDWVPEGLTALPLAARGPHAGEPVCSIRACTENHDGALWHFRKGKVVATAFNQIVKDDGNGFSTLIHSTRPPRGTPRVTAVVIAKPACQADEIGSPLVNRRGELVGISFANIWTAKFEGAHGMAVHISEIKGFLKATSIDRFAAAHRSIPVVPDKRKAPATC